MGTYVGGPEHPFTLGAELDGDSGERAGDGSRCDIRHGFVSWRWYTYCCRGGSKTPVCGILI